MSLEAVLADEVLKLYCEERKETGCVEVGGDDRFPLSARVMEDETVESMRLAVLGRVARILKIPLDPAELDRLGGDSRRVVLCPLSLRKLDEAWLRITTAFSDVRVSNQEKAVREQLFFNAPYYADSGTLSKFVHVLVKKDGVRGSGEAARRAGEASAGEGRSESEPPAALAIRSLVLNEALAVDGFRGVLPCQYKNYVPHLRDRLPWTEKRHVAAVRALYAGGLHFEEGRHSGTFAAGCVFATLLRLYSRRVGVRLEDHVRLAVERAFENVSRFLEEEEKKTPRGGGREFARNGKKFKKLEKAYRKVLEEGAVAEGEEKADGGILEWTAFQKLKDYAKLPPAKYLL